MRPASIVLPMPTSSAMRSRTVGRRSAIKQRHELVGPRLERQASRRAKRPRASAHRQMQRVGQQPRGVLRRRVGQFGRIEARWPNWLAFENRMQK